MKALTLWQPWATLIVEGIKTIETRPRPLFSHWRGPVAIYAGKHVYREACDHFSGFMTTWNYTWKTMPRGQVLGVALVESVAQFPHGDFPPDPYGNFEAGRYGTMLKLLGKFKNPIPARGFQGVWNWQAPADWKDLLDRRFCRFPWLHTEVQKCSGRRQPCPDCEGQTIVEAPICPIKYDLECQRR